MPIPRDRDIEAFVAYLEGRATPEEVEAMERRLREEPGLAESLAVQARMSVMLDSMGRERSRIRQVEEAAPSRFAIGRTRRMQAERKGSSPWTLGLIAASIFIGIAILAVLWSSDPGPAAPQGPSSAERRKAQAERKRAEERLVDLEQERKRLVDQPVSPEKKPESITEEAKKAALADLEERKRRIEAELQAAIARGGTPGPKKEEKPADPTPAPGPNAPPEKRPEEPTQASIAKVLRVAGEAAGVVAGARKPLAAGQEILAGQGIETGGGASLVEIAYPDQTRMEIGADTILKELRGDGGKRVVVEKGSLRAEVKPQPKGQPMVLESLQGEAIVLGTTLKFVVAPDAKEGTTLEVEEGKVRFRNRLSNKSVDVAGGHFSVAAAGIEFSALSLPTVLYAANFDDGRAVGWTFSPKYPWTLRPNPPTGTVMASPAYSFNDPKAQRGELTTVLASKTWQDGVFELDVRAEELDPSILASFLVFVRFRDQENALWFEYLCTRGTWSVALLQQNAGVLTTIASAPSGALEIGRSCRIRLEVKDDEVRAIQDGKEVLRGRTTVLAPGRLALCPMSSRMVFDNIRVTSIPLKPRQERGR